MREWRRVKSIHDLHKKPLVPTSPLSIIISSIDKWAHGIFSSKEIQIMDARWWFFFLGAFDFRLNILWDIRPFFLSFWLIFDFFFLILNLKWEFEQHVKLVAHPLSWFWLWNKSLWGPWIMGLWAISHMYACDLKSAITNLLMRSEMILKAMDVQFSRIYFYDSHGKTIIILVKKNSKPMS